MNELAQEQQAGELAMTLVDQAKAVASIRDDAGYAAAGRTLVSVKNGIKAVKAYWLEPIQKVRAAWDALTERRRQMLEPLESEERNLKSQMVAYMAQTDQKRRADEFVLRAALEAKIKADRDALATEQAAFGDDASAAATLAAPIVVPPVILAGTPRVAGVTFREDWKAEVVDAALVPREFLMVDDAKLTKLAKALKSEARVPGVRFYAEKVVIAGR